MIGSITAIYAALAILLVVGLALNVSWHRRALGVGLGTGDDVRLGAAIRAHGNAAESVPLALMLLLLLELNGATPTVLHALGIALIAGRIAHAQGLLRHGGAVSPGRFYGMLVTWATLGLGAIGLLVLVVR